MFGITEEEKTGVKSSKKLCNSTPEEDVLPVREERRACRVLSI